MTEQNRNPHILLAEDDRMTRDLYQRFFEKAGWAYQMVSNGREACEAIAHDSFDIIITDYRMPELEGAALIKALKAHNPAQTILVVSGEAEVEDALQCLREGATDYLQKPLDFSLFESTIKRLMFKRLREKSEKLAFRHLTHSTHEFTFTSAQLASVILPSTIFDNLVAAGKLSRSNRHRLQIALQEALVNSLDHGNLELKSEWKEDFDEKGIDKYSRERQKRLKDPLYANRSISVRIETSDSEVRIAIQDQGKGFRFNTPQLASAAEEPKMHGRGTALILGCMDSAAYSENGTRLTMIKKLDG